jgi:hypothetical protein
VSIPLLVVAGVLPAAAAAALVARSRMGGHLERLTSARRCRPGEAAAAGPDALVHVSGDARPGSSGALRAPVSGREVVWHRILVTEEYQTTTRDSEGRTSTRTETRTVADDCTTTPFLLAEDGDALEVVPARRQSLRDVPRLADEWDLGGLQIGGVRIGGGSRQRVQEWGVPVGTRLHAVGTLSTSSDGRLRLDANVDRQLRVSLLDPETQAAKAVRNRTLLTVAVVGCGVAGVVAAVIALTG